MATPVAMATRAPIKRTLFNVSLQIMTSSGAGSYLDGLDAIFAQVARVAIRPEDAIGDGPSETGPASSKPWRDPPISCRFREFGRSPGRSGRRSPASVE